VPNALWVGNSRGGVWRTLDGGATWTSVRATDNVRITAIAPRRGDAASAYISRGASSGSRVLRTTNASTWTSLSANLPSGVEGKTLAVDWDRGIPSMYLGSGAGVYASFDGGLTWIKSGPDLPNVNIGQLEITASRRTIAAGTYGRGAWRSALPRRADFNLDARIDGADLSLLLNAWGACPQFNCAPDMDGNGVVDGADLSILLGSWG
jgi:hypothetical protein